MIQRDIFTVLEAALATVKTTPQVLTDIFTNMQLDAAEIAAIITYFKNTDIGLKHGYARTDSAFPLVTITLAGEGSETNFLESAGDDDLDGSDTVSNIWNHSFQIFCYTMNPDTTSYLYEVVKSALLANIPEFFASRGLWDITIAGMDLAPDSRYVPELLFVRVISFKCNDEFLLKRQGTALGKAFKVSGIAVDSAGSPRDVGGVKTKVTTFNG